MSNAGNTRSRNLYQKLVWKMTQVHHSFLHRNNWTANHVAQFVSHAGQFLSCNRAVLNCVQETCTTKNLYKIDQHTCKFLVPEDLYKFLVQISWASVAGITIGFLAHKKMHGRMIINSTFYITLSCLRQILSTLCTWENLITSHNKYKMLSCHWQPTHYLCQHSTLSVPTAWLVASCCNPIAFTYLSISPA